MMKFLYDRVAYATRYGHVGGDWAFSVPERKLKRFNDAVERIVKEENELAKK
jgi:hypothetical protein